MKLIIGLGNPGKEYFLTRHNVAFMVIEELIKHYYIRSKPKNRFKAVTVESLIEGENCYIMMPQTFMNLSGHSVRLVTNWLKTGLKDILVILDDVSMPFGQIRLRAKGSDGGHKGLRSIIECLGSDDFPRLRIGVKGRKVIKNYSSYVLSMFTRKEQKELPDILEYSVSACGCWIKEGIVGVMNKYNKSCMKNSPSLVGGVSGGR